MSLIHPLSQAAAPSCLELFTLPDTQTAVLQMYSFELPSTSTQEGAPRDFVYLPDSQRYTNVNEIRVKGKVQIVHSDGSHLEPGEFAVLLNMYGHTLIKQCDVKYGNQILSLPQQLYGYKCMTQVALARSGEA